MGSDRKQLILELSKEHGLTEAEITRVVSSQFRLVAETIAAGKYEDIRLPGLGVFKTNPKRVKFLLKEKEERDAKRRLADGD